ncbi:response regulator transcription factor [Caulobacter sp. S45]|uniref:response regulator transcription factor n=1 Tax=Caulobacter sp. S45 TaxID=1641861 RepID=UPI0020C6D74A|nr:response regulator [Caulobacter sp. S45]
MSLYDAGGKRIFVAEDDAAIAELLTTRLEIAGYRVNVAHDGANALRLILLKPPAAVILDVNMPKLDGFSVLRTMRSHPACARTPVLMLTARKSAADVRMAREYGANDYLAKPFEDSQLLTRVERLLRSGRTPSAAAAPVPPAVEDGATFL